MLGIIAKNGTQFTFNSDFSGNVIIRANKQWQEDGVSKSHSQCLEVNAADLVEFVFRCFIGPQLISVLESASPVGIIRALAAKLRQWSETQGGQDGARREDRD